MPPYTLTGPAQRDLGDIEGYYVNIANESVAARQIAGLVYRFELLAEFPGMGRDSGSGLRRYTVPRSPFVILYYPRTDHVEIARIIRGIQHVDRAIQ